MSSKVEEVARALATDQMRRTLAAAGLEYEPGQDAFLRDLAIAAIKAMREPTLEMMEDGDRNYRATATSGISGMTIEAQIRSKCVRFGEGWRAAIDAALREEGR